MGLWEILVSAASPSESAARRVQTESSVSAAVSINSGSDKWGGLGHYFDSGHGHGSDSGHGHKGDHHKKHAATTAATTSAVATPSLPVAGSGSSPTPVLNQPARSKPAGHAPAVGECMAANSCFCNVPGLLSNTRITLREVKSGDVVA